MEISTILYEHIYRLQGVRHPVMDYAALCAAREYIGEQLGKWCDSVIVESFYVPGCDNVFHNIDARLGSDQNGPLLLLGCHYDTVYNSPGADDNASGVAAMLTLAELLAPYRDRVNLRLLAFSLEESDPVYEELFLARAAGMGVRDTRGFYTDHRLQQDMIEFKSAFGRAGAVASNYSDRYRFALEDCGRELSSDVRQLQELAATRYAGCDDLLGFGEVGLIGSHHWVERHFPELEGCLGLINFDAVGYASKRPHSHAMLQEMRSIMRTWQVDFESEVGDFIVAVGNAGIDRVANSFLHGAQRVELPYAYVAQSHTYEQTAREFAAVLRSDHAAFWKVGIPVLFLTDTGKELRNPYEHTPADIIDTIDFEFLEKVVGAANFAIRSLYVL